VAKDHGGPNPNSGPGREPALRGEELVCFLESKKESDDLETCNAAWVWFPVAPVACRLWAQVATKTPAATNSATNFLLIPKHLDKKVAR